MLTREAIRAANVAAPVRVEMPEWGGYVFVKRLSPSAAMALGEALKGKSRDESLAQQLATFLCDEQGQALFTPTQAMEDLVCSGLSGPTTRLMTIALRENGMGTPEDVKGNS